MHSLPLHLLSSVQQNTKVFGGRGCSLVGDVISAEVDADDVLQQVLGAVSLCRMVRQHLIQNCSMVKNELKQYC